MKYYKIYLLAATSVVTFVFAYSQNQKPKPAQLSTSQALTAKQRSEAMNQQRLEQLMSKAGVRVDPKVILASTRTYRQVKLHWAIAGTQKTSARSEDLKVQSKVKEIQSRADSLPRQRSLELSETQVLVAAVGASSTLRWWSLIPDPRILRSEGPDSNNILSGEVIYLDSADFSVNIPSDEGIAELRFYHPRWTGQEFDLVLINQISLK